MNRAGLRAVLFAAFGLRGTHDAMQRQLESVDAVKTAVRQITAPQSTERNVIEATDDVASGGSFNA